MSTFSMLFLIVFYAVVTVTTAKITVNPAVSISFRHPIEVHLPSNPQPECAVTPLNWMDTQVSLLAFFRLSQAPTWFARFPTYFRPSIFVTGSTA